MKKATDTGRDPYLALLEFHNTPSEYTHTSPGEKMFGRQQRAHLPVMKETRDTRSMLLKAKEKQKKYHDWGSNPLEPLLPGGAIRMRRPGNKD